MSKKINLNIIIVFLTFLIFFLIPIYKVVDFPYLYAIDPWYHLYFSKIGEAQQFYNNSIQIYDGVISAHYPTLMRSLLYEFQIITGLDYLSIFKYFGFITRLLVGIIFLYLIRFIFRKDNILINCSPLILFTGYYFWYRGYITFTENFIILFQILSLYFSLKFLRYHNNKYIILLILFTSISLYYHSPSSIVSIIIFLGTLIGYFLESISFKRFLRILSYSFLLLILTLPAINIIVNEYIGQIKNNVGTINGYGDLSRFEAPTLKTYTFFQSDIIVILALLGFLYTIRIVRYKYKKYLPLIFLFILTLILSNGTRFQLNLPTDRMQSFIMIPLSTLGFIGLYLSLKNVNKTLSVAILTCIFLIGLNADISINGWLKLSKGEFQITEFLEKTFDNQRLYYFSDSSPFTELQFYHPENIVKNIESLRINDFTISEGGECITRESEIEFSNGKITVCIYK